MSESYRSNNSYLLDVARGVAVQGKDEIFNKFARSQVGNIPSVIWDDGNGYTWNENASVIQCVNINVNDVVGGSGWGTYLVEGVDADGLLISDVVQTGGETTLEFKRVFSAVSYSPDDSAPIDATNAGRINFTHKNDGNLVASILHDPLWNRGEGQTLMSQFTVPSNCKRALLTNVTITTSGTQDIQIKFMYRDVGQPARVAGSIDVDNAPVYSKVFNPALEVAIGADLWLEAKSSSGSPWISIQYDVICTY